MDSKVEITEITFSKSGFKKLCSDRQKLLIQAGTVYNDLLFLNNQLIFKSSKSKTKPKTKLELDANASHILFLVRMTVGVLILGYDSIICKLFNNKLSKNYVSKFDNKMSVSYEALKHLDKNSLVNAVRNKLAFHYDHRSLDSVLNGRDKLYSLFLGEKRGFSLFLSSNQLMGESLIAFVADFVWGKRNTKTRAREFDPICQRFSNIGITPSDTLSKWLSDKGKQEDWREVFEAFLDHLLNQTGFFMEFLEGVTWLLIEDFMLEEIVDKKIHNVEAVGLSTVEVPYFIDTKK